MRFTSYLFCQMKTTATRARVSTVEFVSPKDLHMSVTVLYTGRELTVKVRFHIRYKISIPNGVNPTFCQIQETPQVDQLA